MKKIVVESENKNYWIDLPENWNEVPVEVYPYLARVFLRPSECMDSTDKLVRSLALMLGDSITVLDFLTSEQILDLSKLILWVFEDLNLSINKIPEFTLNEMVYHGPSSDLSNIRFAEFVMSETYFLQYYESGMADSAALNKLVAVLYRPLGNGSEYSISSPNYRGDIREKFNGNLIDHRSNQMIELEPHIKDGIYLFYAAAREILLSYYPNIFPKRSSSTNKSKKGVLNFGWLGVFDDLLGEKGRTAESLEEEFVSTTLMSLERSQIKIKESQKKK